MVTERSSDDTEGCTVLDSSSTSVIPEPDSSLSSEIETGFAVEADVDPSVLGESVESLLSSSVDSSVCMWGVVVTELVSAVVLGGNGCSVIGDSESSVVKPEPDSAVSSGIGLAVVVEGDEDTSALADSVARSLFSVVSTDEGEDVNDNIEDCVTVVVNSEDVSGLVVDAETSSSESVSISSDEIEPTVGEIVTRGFEVTDKGTVTEEVEGVPEIGMNSSLDVGYCGEEVSIAEPSDSSVMIAEMGGVRVAVIPPASFVWTVGEYDKDDPENVMVSTSIMSSVGSLVVEG